jgi:hypothetical protein
MLHRRRGGTERRPQAIVVAIVEAHRRCSRGPHRERRLVERKHRTVKNALAGGGGEADASVGEQVEPRGRQCVRADQGSPTLDMRGRGSGGDARARDFGRGGGAHESWAG